MTQVGRAKVGHRNEASGRTESSADSSAVIAYLCVSIFISKFLTSDSFVASHAISLEIGIETNGWWLTAV